MLKGISGWKRLLAIVLTAAMLFTNNCGVLEVFAESEETKTNLELNAMVVVNNDDGVVDAGEKFQYVLQYTVPNLTDSQYTGAMLSFKLPAYVVLATDSNGNYEISGQDYKNITYNEITGYYTINFNSPLPMHATNTLTINMKTKNLVTPDDTTLNFDKNFKFQAQFQEGNESKQVDLPVQAGQIKTNAESIWTITKENTTSVDGYNYKKVGTGADAKFEVTYRVKVKDQSGEDRLGRLGFERYQVVDTLPTGLPANGGALEIKDVKMIRRTGAVPLTSAEYSVTTENGSPVSITFNSFDVIKEGDTFGTGETSQYMEVGDITDTTYEYTVVYPYAPYTTSGDSLNIILHELVNTAVLDYKLYGKDEAEDSDDAKVDIGAYEENVVQASFNVEKYVKFQNRDPEKLDSAAAAKYGFTGANAVKFTLYTDANCTNVAYNTTRLPAQNIGLNENGVAVFQNIRKGTYYIKEVSSHPGWSNAGVIQVVIDENGNVVYPTGTTAFVAINTASTINAVEFTKTGTDAYNNQAPALAGATFTLTNKADSSKTYTATSDANGKVRFNNIPDGTYTLAETAISDALKNSGYEISSEVEEIVVTGGVVVTPDLGGDNKFENISTKGTLELIKVDAKVESNKLAGAKFEVYGPYATQEAANAAKNNPTGKAATLTTNANGKAVSGPLQKGYYVLVEIKAPTNYTAGAPTVVEVKERQQVSVTVKNDPQAQVSFTKKGAESSSSPLVQELAGTQFEIYDASGNRLYGKKDGNGNYTDVSTDSTGREAVTIVTRLDGTGVSVSNYVTLSPGTYQYKETAVPAPFVAKNELVAFTVDSVAPAAGSQEWNTSQTFTVRNYLEHGQIRVVKKTDDNRTDASSLNGAVFGVYESEADAKADKNRVDTITTGTHTENGKSVHGVGYSDAQLDLNKKYYVKEITAPGGYAVNTNVFEATMTSADKQVEVECENKRTVSIQITKVDSKDPSKKLKGAKFGLYTAANDNKKIAEATTDANGVVTFGNLDPNTTYYYKELTAPTNYVKEEGFKAITTGSTGANATATATVQNDRKATFKLHKTKEGGVAFNGVSFKLIPVKDSTKDILADTSNLSGGTTTTTDSTGNASFTGLTPGSYWLVETAPAGYETGKANGAYVTDAAGEWKVVTYNGKEYFYKKVTVEPGQNIDGYTQKTEEVTNTPTKGKIQIKKYEAQADGTPSAKTISGVVFTVYSDAACTKVATTLTTDGNGTKTSGYLAPGTYYVKETSVPSGYIRSDTVYTVTVEAGKTTTTADNGSSLLTIVNSKKGSFTINKVAAYAVKNTDTNEVVREPLTGATFALYKHEAQFGTNGLPANIEDSKIVATIDMTNVSSKGSGTLDPGIYWLRETVTPEGYKTAADSLVRVNGDGTVEFATWTTGTAVENVTWGTKASNTITIDNESKNPRIRLIKYEYNTTKLLNGAKFEVYVQDDANGVATVVNGETIKLRPVYNDGTFVKTDSNGELVLESGTARNPNNTNQKVNGNAVTPTLTAGHTYYFKEIQAPDGYYFDPDNAWKSVTIPSGQTGEYRVEFENYPNIQVPGIKYGPDGKTPLSGAVLAIFDNQTDANAMLDRLTNTYSELTNVLTEATVNANKAAWNIDAIVKSDASGVFSFANLIPGKTYYIVEVVAPNNYQMDKDASGNYFYYKVTVSDPYNTSKPFSAVYKGDTLQENTYTLSIVNYLKRQIWLDKKAVLSGAEFWVSGAVFTIYPSKTENGVAVPDTSVTLVPNTLGQSGQNIPGRFLSGLLPAGTYWLKESTVPEGFEEADRNVVNSAFGTNAQDYIVYNNERYYRVDLGRTEDNEWFLNNPVYNVAENGKFALTKINSVTKKNVAATFTVENLDDGTFTSFTFTTPSSGYYLSSYLPAGLYKLTEESVTGNYTISDEPIYIRIASGKITDGTVTAKETVGGKEVTVYQPTPTVEYTQSGTNDPVLKNSVKVQNVPQGKFYILKTGTWNGTESENLANVSFDVYKKTSDSFENDKAAGKVKTITTGSNGIADSGILDAGEYWIIETGITGNKADEYKKDSYTAIAVTVTAGQTKRVTTNTAKVVNTSNYGKFQVTKVDSLDATIKISDVTFAIYDNAACTGTPVGTMTGSNGTYTSPKLPTGKDYYLKETNAPADYTINVGKIFGPYTVTANTLTVVDKAIVNEHDKSLTVYKYEKHGDTETQTKINGVVFGLYATQEAAAAATAQAPGNAIGGVKTTTSGSVAWNDLADGTYYLKELSAPDKYLLQDNASFTATEDNPAVNIYRIVISGKNENSFAYSRNIYNLVKGGFKLDKVILWTNGQTTGTIPGGNIAFDLYRDSVSESNWITTLTTGATDGKISYLNSLPAGDYILVEKDATVEGVNHAYNKPAEMPDNDNDGNYIDSDGNIHIRILASATNEVFTGSNAVQNAANYGRFQLYKKTYSTNDHSASIGLNGAEYRIEKYVEGENGESGSWVLAGEIKVNDSVWSNGMYVSGAMEPGRYRVIETKAPNAYINSNNQEVVFIVDPTPIEFTIEAAATVEVTQYDGIYRNLVVTKKADNKNGSQTLAGVTFELYKANAAANAGEYPYNGDPTTLAAFKETADAAMIGTAQTTGNDGVVTFNTLLPGKYLLVETVAPEGYERKVVVIVISESLSYLDVDHAYTLVDTSEMGRIIIRKEDSNGKLITVDSAKNAQFKVYAQNDAERKNALCTVSVDNTGYAQTSLLPTGYYWVVEVKAPEGYTLDERLQPLEKLVYVTGDQDPEVNFAEMSKTATDGYQDGVIFQNSTPNTTCASAASIQKLVRLAGGTEFADDLVTSDDSLMYQDVTAEFKITNLTNPQIKNEIPFSKFIVTDESMKFMDKEGAAIAALANPTSSDYVMNKVTIGRAYNDDPEKTVTAKIFAKVGNKDAQWQLVDEVVLSTESQVVMLPADAIAFKVEYSNADVGFTVNDIYVEVTFKQRPSDPTVPQVRKVENRAVLNWEDTTLNENGEAAHQKGEIADVAAVAFPAYDENLPMLELKNDIVNKPSSGMYYSGGTIDFKTTGAVPVTSPEDLHHPVMSINLPPYTSLDTTKYSETEGGINGIRATLKNGTVCKFAIKKVIENNEHGQPYEKYVLDFGENFVLPKGDSITLEYTANISLSVPDTTISIESRGFIGSGKQLPLTLENPTGMSYLQADSDGSTVVSNDAGFDAGLEELGNDIDGDKLTYLRRPVHVELTRTDSRFIRKYVSVDGQNWLTTEVPVVKPGDNYYYKLQLVNGGDPVRRIRMIDILPFNGDTQEFRAMAGGTIMSRATNLPSGAGYEQVQLVSVAPQTGTNLKVTVYYYVETDDVTLTVANRDWTAANRGSKTATAELPMLTSNAAADVVWAGWTTTAPADMRTVTAIGIEVEYLDGESLEGGEDYSVVITMRAPGYTAEQQYDYEDALIANTTAGTVTRVGAADTSAVTAIDRVSSNEVLTKLYITTGAIGDYAFYDNNDNGIQDAGDIPARNIPVTLYRRVSKTGMTEEPKWEVYKTTYTDQTSGKYWFDELPCNYMIPGLDQTAEGFDPTDPANYIGNTYFEYQVEFGIPEGYAATIREAGENRAVDSNINEFGVTDPITLALTVNADGKLEGEINPTIDAGYVKLVNLGDYVWIDYNNNGVQDESEIGLNGATVNLYKLESTEDTIEGKTPYRTQLTQTKDGHDGYYLFSDLPKGYYVVEFDISTAEKDGGYTTKYAFTANDAGSDGADSDAAFVRDENDQVMYTEVIHLTEDDMTWDAGVTVYSALGGFVFDDQDYNDTQSIPTEVNEETTANGIPLPGTVVTLYKVNEDGSMDPEPVGQQTVGEDGRYFFDKLDAGRYKVHFDYPDNYIGVKEGVGDYLHDSETKFFDESSLNSGFTDIIELPPDTADLTHDAGAYLTSSIGDYVWEDLDRDGIQDEDEIGVEGITVTLQQKLGDGEWTTIETTITDEDGLYLFEGLKSSDHYDVQYRVAFAIPLTVVLTGDNVGENRAEDSNALPELDVDYGYFTNEVKPPYGEDDLTIDAGLYYKDELCEVGDYVWYDKNKDGIQDEDEKGVEGIVVVLERCESGDVWDEDAWEVVATTKTDADGKYIFEKLLPGRYRIAFGLNKPWIVTVPRVGDAALDSDAIRQSEDYYYTSAFFLNAGDSDMTWDAGIYRPTIVPGSPITGDNSHIVVWMAILLGSMTILIILFTKNKKKK